MPARNWAMPPAVRAKGNRTSWVSVLPYQPAMLAATMKVAAAKPNSPRMDGAATGDSTIVLWSRQKVWSAVSASAVRPLVIVLTSPPDVSRVGSFFLRAFPWAGVHRRDFGDLVTARARFIRGRVSVAASHSGRAHRTRGS